MARGLGVVMGSVFARAVLVAAALAVMVGPAAGGGGRVAAAGAGVHPLPVQLGQVAAGRGAASHTFTLPTRADRPPASCG